MDNLQSPILTHYFHKNEIPFKNLSALTEIEALKIISNLCHRPGLVYRRFDNPELYLKQRQLTENWVRQEFIKKGGQPALDYPHYFVMGHSKWIEEGYNGESHNIQFPISNFHPNVISFTYPDSMISYWLNSQTDRVYYQPEYHGRVFTLNEILQIIERFGIPDEEWRTDETRKFDLFIEAQVWASIP
jgi:hypothetical protein